jgi:hypothetical protein
VRISFEGKKNSIRTNKYTPANTHIHTHTHTYTHTHSHTHTHFSALKCNAFKNLIATQELDEKHSKIIGIICGNKHSGPAAAVPAQTSAARAQSPSVVQEGKFVFMQANPAALD